ncbi:helix-turn-helix transcriptional regulator [Pseudodesulfovibrio piezophilus]|uniref:helix-turn-helix transcriptional regulator n=1 Tax=Pseudodesulfovibrio piezophilus TaxID=879567 RepID=UPI0005A1D95C|nr:AlpA family phage regulatory protein [Pseudodesulfovibrio piezophilus]
MKQPFPQVGFVRLPQVLAVIPLSRSTWLRGVKSGKYPKPVQLTKRTRAWRVEDILELIDSLSETAAS